MALGNNPLGKGLGALLPNAAIGKPAPATPAPPTGSREFFDCPIETIRPNPYQPRKDLNNEKLEELSASIRQKGVLQPLLVRKADDSSFEIIAGERRWRAARLAGLQSVPVIVKEVNDHRERLELALIENIQRQNLNAVEEADSYKRLMDDFALNQEEIAKRVGKERSTVANALRLLQLPDYIKEDIKQKRLSAGHARALLRLHDNPTAMRTLRDEILAKKLSVRQAEGLAKRLKKAGEEQAQPQPSKKGRAALPAAYCSSLASSLEKYLGSKSKIIQNGNRGKVEIEYYSPDDLERLLGLILGEKA